MPTKKTKTTSLSPGDEINVTLTLKVHYPRLGFRRKGIESGVKLDQVFEESFWKHQLTYSRDRAGFKDPEVELVSYSVSLPGTIEEPPGD